MRHVPRPPGDSRPHLPGDSRPRLPGGPRPRLVVGVLAALAVLLVGCASDDSSTEAETGGQAGGDAADAPDDVTADAEQGGDEATDDEGGQGAGGGGALLTDIPPDLGRDIVRTARVTALVEDVERAAARVRALTTRVGGIVSDAQVRTGEDPFGVLTLRVPSSSLDEVVEELSGLSDEVEVAVTSEDVTDQLTDLQARLTNLRALETELRELLGEVRGEDPDAAEVLQVFDRLSNVRGEIERLAASRAALQDRVALSTVTVELQPVAGAALVGGPDTSPLTEAWAATRSAFGTLAELAIWLVVTVVPVTAAVVLPLVGLVALVRALRRREQEPADGPRRPSSPPPPARPTGDDGRAGAGERVGARGEE